MIDDAYRVLDEFEAVSQHTEAMKVLPLEPCEEIAFPIIRPGGSKEPEDLQMNHDAIDAEIAADDARCRQAKQNGAKAFARLLKLAEECDSGQIPRIAHFLAATYNSQFFQFDLFELRAVDIAISDDMLNCLDALRWARADLHTLIADGDARVRAVIERWGLPWPNDA